jgi:plasmid stability protein
MPSILVRGLDKTIERLKARTKESGRSLQAEAKRVLEEAAGVRREEIAAMFERWDKRLGSRAFVGSVELIREDRER